VAIDILPVVALSQASKIVPVQSLTGGSFVMVITPPIKAYRVIGFTIGLYSKPGAAGAGPTTWVDGRIKVPIQIQTLPSANPLAQGELELFFAQYNASPTQAMAAGILGYADLHGVIYPNVSQLIAQFNLPNTAQFTMGQALAALIVEDFCDCGRGR
jgi:hypothetical protein